ncbi:hypothetical protein [Alkalicoccobacillus murimartini]|uniref:Stage II sporulation protein B n=1 Tax=Alkalicoccobacillus murimartini TaxID=171685 RepID=A0ABT9YJH8_9BACI|nr:hypothetical protein [Alkalicoccobacillus murimartini]MDQ0208008.1 stage II sporulation protein B [Alkalicoccobacillus murimartini]
MEQDKRTISIQFAKDGTRRNKVDKRKSDPIKTKPEIDWVFPEPDHAVESVQPIEVQEEEKREIHYWNEHDQQPVAIPIPTKKKKLPTLKTTFNIPWMLVAAVASAVLIGVSLGVVMLTFSTGSKDQLAEQPAVEVGTTAMAPVVEEEQTTSFELYVIQGGAFSTKEAGTKSAETFKQDGHAAVIETGGESDYLYIGATGSKEQAIQVVELYEKAGYDAFVKKFAVDEVKSTDEHEAATEWFQQAGKHLAELAEASAASLAGTSLEDEALIKLTNDLTQLESQREVDMAELSDEIKASAQTIMAKLAESNQLIAGITEENQEDAWVAQQIVLDAVMTYKKSVGDLSDE